jgi:hypothetical protein
MLAADRTDMRQITEGIFSFYRDGVMKSMKKVNG